MARACAARPSDDSGRPHPRAPGRAASPVDRAGHGADPLPRRKPSEPTLRGRRGRGRARASAGGRAAGDGDASRGAPGAPVREGHPQELQHRGPRLSRLHPGRRAASRRGGGPDRRLGQPLRRRVRGRSGSGAAGGQRRPMVLPHRGPAGLGARHPDLRRIAGELLGDRRGAPGEAARELPARHPLCVGPDPLLGRQGRRPRRFSQRERPPDPQRRPLPDASRRARAGDRGGPGRRPIALPRGRQRRDDEHRSGRRSLGAGRDRPPGEPLASRRRGVRRLLFADRRGPTPHGGHRAGGLHRARSAQGAVSALRHRRAVWSATRSRCAGRTP